MGFPMVFLDFSMGFSQGSAKPRRHFSARRTPAPKTRVSGFGSLEAAWLKRPGMWDFDGFWMGKWQLSHSILGHDMEIVGFNMDFFPCQLSQKWMVILMGFWWLTLKSWGKIPPVIALRVVSSRCVRQRWHNHWNELLHDLSFGIIFTAERPSAGRDS